MVTKMLDARHIQNMSEAKVLEPHWGYADRALPCTNDAGSCQYLDSVYRSHDLGMLYSGIIWATIGGILLIWHIGWRLLPSKSHGQTGLEVFTSQHEQPQGAIARLRRTMSAVTNRWLLPEFARSFFGRTTRLQVLVLALLVSYLTIFTFAGIEYRRWITPVKNNPGLHNIRSGLGPFSDRVGVLAYALIPLSVLLSSRESILSLVTGIPYQHFNFIHRWLGYLIFVQSILHTIGWSIIEVRLYQPQPKVAREWITQLYMIWGIVAQLFLILLFVLSLRPVIRLTGYEFFRKAHYVIAMLFIGACWGHWEQLKCFLLPSLLIWFIDRGARLIRTWLIHYRLTNGKVGFTAARANLTSFPDSINGDVVRLDFDFIHDAWIVGQHFYLCFPELSIWQSHPFTPLSLPNPSAGLQRHSYIVRAKTGETKKLAALANRIATTGDGGREKGLQHNSISTPVILAGPYGEKTLSDLDATTNVLCIAGGSGITYVLPVLLHLAQLPAQKKRNVGLVWAIRRKNDIEWIRPELDLLETAAESHGIALKIYVTRECCEPSGVEVKSALAMNCQLDSSTTSSDNEITGTKRLDQVSISRSSISSLNHVMLRLDLKASVADFIDNTVKGPSIVYASGPSSMISELRKSIAESNKVTKVWKGDQRSLVSLVCDDRLEW